MTKKAAGLRKSVLIFFFSVSGMFFYRKKTRSAVIDRQMTIHEMTRLQTTTKINLDTVIQDTLKIGQRYSTVPRAKERVRERANERVSAVERASEARHAEQANEEAVRANERADERVAQYLQLDFNTF